MTDSPPPPPDAPAPPRVVMTPRRQIKRLARLLGVMAIVYLIAMFSLQRYLIFPRYMTRAEPNAGVSVPGLDRWWIDTPDGKVEAWFLPGVGVSATNPGPAVIFAHGNAELIEHWPDFMQLYRSLGVSVLLPEFRGYGRSAGSPSQAAITSDYVRFYDMLATRPEVDKSRIVFHGRSIGNAALCALAAQRPPAAMVMQSAFISIVEMSKRFLVPSFFISDPFDNLSVVSKLTCPVILFHGRQDTIIPFRHGEALHAACKQSKFIAYDSNHNDCPPDWDAFMNDVTAFLREAGVLVGRK